MIARRLPWFACACICQLFAACQENKKSVPVTPSVEQYAAGTYGFDAAIVKKYQKDFVELKDDKGLVKVLISTQYQGRVMTSTLGGDSGTGFGWVNHKLIEAQQKLKQFNPVGGEERFWLGPEGGQFALYFSAGDSFNIKNWQVPPVLDTLPYSLVTADRTTASFYKEASLVNYAGTRFDIAISRKIRLLENEAIGPAIRRSATPNRPPNSARASAPSPPNLSPWTASP